MRASIDDATTEDWDSVRWQTPHVLRRADDPHPADTQVRDYKQSQGKPRYDLMPFEAQEEVAKVFTLGAEKYEDHRWRGGVRAGALFAATMRHCWAWWAGRDEDPETGKSHIAHAISNLMMLLSAYQVGSLDDDRPMR